MSVRPVSEKPARQSFAAELEQLRLQVEVMGVRVDENLERTREVLRTGDLDLARVTVEGDDLIDAMNVSLTERCYELMSREAPVAGDLRFVLSVLRVLSELERIGDLCLRVVKLAPDWDLLRAHPQTYDLMLSMADTAVDQVRLALRAWSTQDLGLAAELADDRPMEVFAERFSRELLGVVGPDAVLCAVRTLVVGRSLDRIADHAVIIGARLRYMITGDPLHLTAEIR